jgi:predicted GNAT superfamily acetyltransferase
MHTVTYRDLTTLEEFAAVVDLEREIWGPGYDEVVPVPILAVTVMRGGILVGAFVGKRMVGFVYSLPGIKDGKPTQWSHMLGVLDAYRNDGAGQALKLLQRERTLAMGLDLIEWTYDPMQAMNAHLNFVKLGVVVEEYEVNVYGESSSPLHRGNPTDRFVCEWWIRTPHVERRVETARR